MHFHERLEFLGELKLFVSKFDTGFEQYHIVNLKGSGVDNAVPKIS